MKEYIPSRQDSALEINEEEFNLVRKQDRIRVQLGLVIGAVAKLNGIWVLILQDNGEKITRPLREVVSAAESVWGRIEKIARPKTRGPANIRPRGNYSKLSK